MDSYLDNSQLAGELLVRETLESFFDVRHPRCQRVQLYLKERKSQISNEFETSHFKIGSKKEGGENGNPFSIHRCTLCYYNLIKVKY